ncbi:unnamed protein product [Owenia fusiformis]|uniref:Uncharacterized protein n=1 Tax=Owenia fusiformis TaxID=6347 RepID=A0A8J1UHN8_OWEFU|nr:unnamed protein product [Owenia fusiformis]
MNQEQLPSSNNDNVQDRTRSLSGSPNTSGSLNDTSAVPTSVWGIPLNPPTVPTGANKCSASSTKDISNVPATPITLSASSTCSAPTATCTSAVKTKSGTVTCSASDVSIECSASHTPTMSQAVTSKNTSIARNIPVRCSAPKSTSLSNARDTATRTTSSAGTDRASTDIRQSQVWPHRQAITKANLDADNASCNSDDDFVGVRVHRTRTKKIVLAHVKSQPYNTLRKHLVN